MKTMSQNSQVLFAIEPVREIKKKDVLYLKEKVLNMNDGKLRICLHRNSEEDLHEMLIALRCDVLYPPHSHPKTEESYFLVDGKATLLIYSNSGEIINRIELDSNGNAGNIYVRIPAGMIHCLIIESEVCVYLETKLGPFDALSTVQECFEK